MSQANVSRAKAVRALKNNNNDIVNAIMVRFFKCDYKIIYILPVIVIYQRSIPTLLWWWNYSDFRSSEFTEANISVLRRKTFNNYIKRSFWTCADLYFLLLQELTM